jgi:hypothetical protein
MAAHTHPVILSGAKDLCAKRVRPPHRTGSAGGFIVALRNDEFSFVNNPG